MLIDVMVVFSFKTIKNFFTRIIYSELKLHFTIVIVIAHSLVDVPSLFLMKLKTSGEVTRKLVTFLQVEVSSALNESIYSNISSYTLKSIGSLI